jgi:hypothetical protein
MSRTIQDTLAPGAGRDGNQIEYIETVDAYNKWAEVSFRTLEHHCYFTLTKLHQTGLRHRWQLPTGS